MGVIYSSEMPVQKLKNTQLQQKAFNFGYRYCKRVCARARTRAYVHVCRHVKVKLQLCGAGPPLLMDPSDHTHITRLCGKHLYPQRHLTSPRCERPTSVKPEMCRFTSAPSHMHSSQPKAACVRKVNRKISKGQPRV